MADQVKIFVKAGDGGKGCTSFKGKKFTRTRRADGGSGGRGADVIIQADAKVSSLTPLQFRQHFRAENGKQGSANKKRGANARPCIIKVPVGTIIRDQENNLLLRDLKQPGEQVVAAKGAQGGRGNTKTAPAMPGFPGEQKQLLVELKLISDIGIIGYPNTGKSTLIAQISSARPKVAHFPFTTKAPFLAVVKFPDFEQPETLTIIELPGLLRGSNRGKGLGIAFLRHAERCKLLLHLIDMSNQEGRDAFTDYENLNQELKEYSNKLDLTPQVLAANKMDLPEALGNFKRFCAQLKDQVFPISALNAAGIEELLKYLRGLLRQE